MYYNFGRVHQWLTAISDDGTRAKRTPAMAAGITDHVGRWVRLPRCSIRQPRVTRLVSPPGIRSATGSVTSSVEVVRRESRWFGPAAPSVPSKPVVSAKMVRGR